MLALTALLAPPTAAQSVTYNCPNVQIVGGGYVPEVIFNQTQQGLAYVRTDVGGTYRWNATTNAWVSLLDGANTWQIKAS